ncbi:MAG: hypothetical protein ACRCVV_22065 [Shewanella sp.]
MAITWRNVDAPNFAASNALGVAAGKQITQGIDALSGLATNQANEIQDTNTQTVLDRVYAMHSVDEVDNALKSGEFSADSLMKEFGKGGVNLGKVQEALMNQDNQVMEEDNLRYEYNTNLTKRRDAPLLDRVFSGLVSAKTDKDVAATMEGVDSLGLSEAGTLAANQAAMQAYQRLLEARDADENRTRINASHNMRVEEFKQGAELHGYNVDRQEYEKQARFINDYDPERKTKIQSGVSSQQSLLEGLDKKFPSAVNYEEVVETGTYLDAINDFMTGLDEKTVNKKEVSQQIINKLTGGGKQLKEYKIDKHVELVNGNPVEGVKTYTIQNLPKWVVKQALQTVGEINNDWYFSDWGKAEISTPQRDAFEKAIKSSLTMYEEYRANETLKQAAKNKINSAIIDLNMQELQRVMEGKETYQMTQANAMKKNI